MIVEHKTVFISYAWSNDEHIDKVQHLAERLNNDGIYVKFDKWDLHEGQNIYAFMEQCVNNPDVEKVLIICDKTYVEKANGRVGGVGTETNIISPEVYTNVKQEKFIPIIFEKDDRGNAYLPTYLKGNLYIDLTGDNYETGYEQLVRNIYDKPAVRRPQLGEKPKWLDEEPTRVNKLKQFSRNISHKNFISGADLETFTDEYIANIKLLYKRAYETPQEYLDDFGGFLEFRNIFLDFIKLLDVHNQLSSDFLTNFFERLVNETCNLSSYEKNIYSSRSTDLELFRIHVWEMFVCVITYLLKNSSFAIIRDILVHTYFISCSVLTSNKEACSFAAFRTWPNKLEGEIKYSLEEHKNKFTLLGHYVCTMRVNEPIYNGREVAAADLFLYQIYKGLNIDQLLGRNYWFPNCYVYTRENDSIWKRLVSKKFCYKVMELFEVESIEKLKERLEACKHDKPMAYSSCFDKAPDILDFIRIDEIGTLP